MPISRSIEKKRSGSPIPATACTRCPANADSGCARPPRIGCADSTRKRIGQGLVEAFSEECPTCKGRGFILHDQPTVSADYDDPYALKGGDPFVKTNKHGHGTDVQVPKGSSPDVKAKLARIAAAAVAANNADLGEEEQEE